MFGSGTDWASDYTSANKDMKKKYSENEAQLYALSYVLDKYNTGIKIYKRAHKEDNFKEQNVIYLNNDYSHIECP
jgi:hypothetical protein